MSLDDVTATRMELFVLKKRVKLAEKGYSLLKEKRDALVMEFFNIFEERKSIKSEMEKEVRIAYEALRYAYLALGYSNVVESASSITTKINLDIESRNIMGVNVPKFKNVEISRNFSERGYGLFSTSVTLDEAARQFELALEKIIRLSEIDGTLKKLAKEIEKTKRRVNALEFIFIPKLKATIKYIQMRLDEMERENFFRLKRIKRLIEAEA